MVGVLMSNGDTRYKTLEEVLQDYFGCKKVFTKTGELTVAGNKAYNKLIELMYDLQSLGLPIGERIDDELDSIIDGPDY